MKRARLTLVVRGLLPMGLWIVGCAASQREPVPVEQREWTSQAGVKGTQFLTEHFDLRVTAKDEMLREYLPTFMETAFSQYEALVPPARVVFRPADSPSTMASDSASTEANVRNVTSEGHDENERLIVYLFETRDQWAQFTRAFRPAQADTYLHILSGAYTDYSSATAVAYDLRRERTLSLLAHEGLHQYLARYFPDPVPAWANEGLATQFESFDLQGPVPHFTPQRNYSRRNNLRELLSAKEGLLPLKELLRMDAGEAITATKQPTRAFYAQVWSLVLFLREPSAPAEYREGFARLLADLGTDRMKTAIRAQRAATPDSDRIGDGELLFRHYITEDLAKAEAEYRQFAEALLR